MAQPYIGEIRMFAGNFAPVGWSFCDGQLLPIAENEALFQLIGTTYGGDGEETFALPNLQSRIPPPHGERDERASLISWQRRAAQSRRR
jgi:microcystin-dependent protein